MIVAVNRVLVSAAVNWIADVARTMKYKAAYDIYRRDVEYATPIPYM